MLTATHHVRATLLTVIFLLPCSCSSKGTRATVINTDSKTFAAARSALDAIMRTEGNGVPDAVLNRTRCVTVIPAAENQGIVSCFESLNRWSSAMPVVFQGTRPAGSDLIVFVLGAAQAKQIAAGHLVLERGSVAAGPLVSSKAVITDADLNFAALGYQRRGTVLSGAVAQGAIMARAAAAPARTDQKLQAALASFFNTITPSGIIIHHTAVLPDARGIPKDKKQVDAYHSTKGFDIVCFGREYHVAYHYLILPNGTVQEGRPERCQGAHAKGYNAYLGISVVGDFSSKDNPDGSKGPKLPTVKQEQSLIQLCRRLSKHYNIPIHRILRHSDVAPTQCPGDRFPFVATLRALQHQ